MMKLLKTLVKCVFAAILAFVGGVFIANATFEWRYGPQQEDVYAKATESVVQVVAPNLSEGTAFSVRGASGDKYLVTNAHVCEQLASAGGYAVISADDGGFNIPVKIRAISDKYDLCALTLQVDFLKPLEIDEDYHENQRVFVAGFPMVPFLSVVEGRVGGLMDFQIPIKEVNTPCVGPKFKVDKLPLTTPEGIDFVDYCFMVGQMLMTTAASDLGNSGSPVLNEDMKVIGVVMISRGLTAHAGAVPAKFLVEFLSNL